MSFFKNALSDLAASPLAVKLVLLATPVLLGANSVYKSQLSLRLNGPPPGTPAPVVYDDHSSPASSPAPASSSPSSSSSKVPVKVTAAAAPAPAFSSASASASPTQNRRNSPELKSLDAKWVVNVGEPWKRQDGVTQADWLAAKAEKKK
jgi:hypothetical protein